MTTTADIFDDLDAFLTSLDELLRTSTAKEAPNMAASLGVASQLNSALDLFAKALNELEDAVARLQGPLVQTDAVVAGLEMVSNTLKYLGEGECLNDLSDFFELPGAPFQPLVNGFKKSSQYLDVGLGLAGNLPSPAGLRETGRRLHTLAGTVEGLKAKPEASSSPPPIP